MDSNTIFYFSFIVLILYAPLFSIEQMENESNSIVKEKVDFFSNGSKFGIHSNTNAPSNENNIDHMSKNITRNNIQEIPLGIPVEKEYFEKLKEQAKDPINK
jgi:hypothetical protein